ncbi:hypothetical protein CORC01_00260 [Colletotrichum orchidophilum]|uniref:BTB domain-containing protein n=1 Tax=Colletotrichum orchidophilum TaxID=1209926 RepID=A0A1G4BSP8_9PEZI|nr:uncharacterized protein CORC01_00260 [Colletotrichum orchidophilum]OHF04408.1 hypothetical protein CORC01_00260 [Colletotrichum orchidophilum]
MGRLDLSFLLESGSYSDLRIITTEVEDGSETEYSVHRNILFTQCPRLKDLNREEGVDIVHLDYRALTLGSILQYLYSGQYEALYEQPLAVRRASEADLEYQPHSMYWSLHTMQLAHELELVDLYGEAADALCCSAQYLTNHVDFPGVIDELYETCSQHSQFPVHLAKIASTIAENCLIKRRMQDRLQPIMLKHPQLALDTMEASMDALAEARRELIEAQEEISDLRAQGYQVGDFWVEAERERERDRERREEEAARDNNSEYQIVRGSKKRSRSTSSGAGEYPEREGEI